jgi:type IV secretory pathway TraG/TraD family ATPase VirD4
MGEKITALNLTAADKGVALLRPEDVRTMPKDEQLIFYKNVKPIRTKRRSYWNNPFHAQLADLNPYRRFNNQ